VKKLTDADIIPNYTYATAGELDDGEVLDCRRCGAQSKTPGTKSYAWTRIPNKATHLPRSIELCATCDHQVRQLQSNEA
jgi:hypothetical protein